MAAERSKRTINTAGCIIIGDEVLGGKVSSNTVSDERITHLGSNAEG